MVDTTNRFAELVVLVRAKVAPGRCTSAIIIAEQGIVIITTAK
jgi:hypothetical protein